MGVGSGFRVFGGFGGSWVSGVSGLGVWRSKP